MKVKEAGLVAGLLMGASAAWAQAALPDAQVEANVLKALASAPELANEPIQTRTVYGTVTLSGTVTDEVKRSKAETLASRANGVKKVVDELTLPGAGGDQASTADGVLQSDGTYGPPDSAGPQQAASNQPNPAAGVTAPQRNNPEADQALDQQMDQQPVANGQPSAPGGQQPIPQQVSNGGYPPQGPPPQGQYPSPQGQYPQAQGQYPQGQYPPPQGQYQPQQGYPPYGQRPSRQPYAGQVAGQAIMIPAGALVQVRINEHLASNHSAPGEVFHGVVVNDVFAGNAVAIPRGASVQGTVVDAKKSGALAGRGEMSVQLTQLMLGGKTYPIVSDVWSHAGPDKTLQTVNRTVGLGAVGAVIGAVAGGGAGAAIGAGAGAAAGLGTSAASGKGQVVIPSEALLTFHLTQPTPVTTVSQQEMQRLAYGVPAGGPPPPGYYARRPYYYYPPPPPPPGYYPPQ